MKELVDLQKAWEWLTNKCRNSLGWIVLMLLSGWIGSAVATKAITDDCKFMGSFRDGAYSFNCSIKPR